MPLSSQHHPFQPDCATRYPQNLLPAAPNSETSKLREMVFSSRTAHTLAAAVALAALLGLAAGSEEGMSYVCDGHDLTYGCSDGQCWSYCGVSWVKGTSCSLGSPGAKGKHWWTFPDCATCTSDADCTVGVCERHCCEVCLSHKKTATN